MRALWRAAGRRVVIAEAVILALSAFFLPQIPGLATRSPGIFSLNPPDEPASGTLAYATLLGGNAMEIGWGIAVDSSGSAYVAGTTTSPDFPVTPGAFQTAYGGQGDAFVAKLSPDGSQVVWATYLGGSRGDGAGRVVVDSSDNVYVIGGTGSLDFPTTSGAFAQTLNGTGDAFVTKLSPDGSQLLWSTYLGGSRYEQAQALAINGAGNVYVAGSTVSPDFPVTPGAYDMICGTDGTCNDAPVSNDDVFVTELSSDGRSLVWSTFLGAEKADQPWTIVVDAVGFAVVAGITSSSGFPATPGAFQSYFQGGGIDAFIAKLSPDGSALAWATFLGGSDEDAAFASLAPTTAITVCGGTNSSDFPVTPSAYQTTLGGGHDAFIGELSPDGQSLIWATYLGGTANDGCNAVWDYFGSIRFTGWTGSSSFPVTPDALDPTYNGGPNDAFIAQLDSAGTRLTYATFLGGNGEDGADHSVLDAAGNVYVSSRTTSTDFPATPGAFDTSLDGPRDAYAAKLMITAPANTPPTLSWTGESSYIADGLNPEMGTNRTTFSYRVFYADADGDRPTQIEVRIEKPIGTIWGDLPMSLVLWRGVPGNYTTGAIYALNTTLQVGSDFWYSFHASDGWDPATGPPTVPIDAPDVVADNPPVALAQVSPTVAHMGDMITFDATDSFDDFGITAYEWDFDDGATDTNVVTTHAYVSRGIFSVTLTVWDTTNQNDTDNVSVTIENRPPTAAAGADRTVPKKILAVLDGTGSSDPDHDELAFSWTQTGGPTAAVLGENTPTPSFTPPTSGLYRFQLTVDDRNGGLAADAVEVMATNNPPVAVAGSDQSAKKNTSVSLNGSRSFDSDRDTLAFTWAQISGPVVNISDLGNSTVTFTPANIGTYAFRLTVNDGDGGSSEDTATVTVWGLPPVADLVARPASIHVGGRIEFDASGSADPDGVIVDFAFLFGDDASASGSAAVRYHSYAAPGLYTVTLTVTDDDGNVSTDSLTVEVTSTPPSPEVNYKPLVAVIFAVTLLVAGVWSSKRRPWKGGKDRTAVVKAFVITSMPFVLVEAATGAVSYFTGQLSIPPLVEVGTVVDLSILIAGICVVLLRAYRPVSLAARGDGDTDG